MVGYNLTGISGNMSGNNTGLLVFTQGVNDVLLGGWLGALLLIGIFAVIYMSTMFTTNSTQQALIVSSFICFSLSIPLVALDLLTPLGMWICLFILIATLFFSWKNT